MTAIRCPYCVEGKSFKVMIAQGIGDWYTCARCGHLVKPANPHFRCTCANCVEQEPLKRKPQGSPS